MKSLDILFLKSIKTCKHIKISLIEDYLKVYGLKTHSTKPNCKHFYEYALARTDYGLNQDLIIEILSIEYEKILLTSSVDELHKIGLLEQRLNIEREALMFMETEKVMKTILTINPFVQTYESSWKIVFENSRDEYLYKNVETPKGDFYFLFQKIGFYDNISQNNIFEYELTKYEYFFIQLFENEDNTPYKALKEFASIFEYKTQEEYHQIKLNFIQILFELLFKKILIKK